jgi:hypothetical protein
MKVVKKTSEYTIYQRRDERYAVESSAKKAINGDDKVGILAKEGLLKVAVAKKPEPEVVEEAVAEEAPAEASKGDAAAE